MSGFALLGRVLALLIGLACAVAFACEAAKGSGSAAQIGLVAIERGVMSLIPVALIWFSEQIGAASGFIGHGEITAETPAVLVAVAGWIGLAGILYLAITGMK